MKVVTREHRVPLPAPAHEGRLSLEQALTRRRSARHFARKPLDLAKLGQLLWATQGITRLDGSRTTPSAGAAYPLEVHVVAGAVQDLWPGHYRYLPRRHQMLELAQGDLREELARVAEQQEWIAEAAAVLVVTAVAERTTFTHGARGERYVEQEVGCAAQNLQLQAVSLRLASAVVGAFDDDEVARILGLFTWERPHVLLPVGHVPDPVRGERGVEC